MNPRLRGLLATGVVLLAASSAQAKDYTITGEVVNAVPALASYGVAPGATVHVSWTVDLSTPASSVNGPPDNKSDYQGAVDFVLIQIGTWSAVRVAPPMGQIDQGIVSVADASNGSLDLLHLATPGTDNDLVLHGPAIGGVLLLSLDFYAPSGGASSSQSLDQNPALYPIGVGSAIGTGGYVTFRISGSASGGGGGSGDPTAKCLTTQLGAAAKLCQSQLKCESSYAKAPAKDPIGAKRDACVDKAQQAFTAAYNKALLAAVGKGLTCGTTAPAADLRDAIAERVGGIVDDVNAITPAHPPLVSAWLGAAGAACGAGLKVEAKDASKPNPGALAAARAKVTDKLTASANKAVTSAGKKGVVFAPPADVPGFVDSVDALIDATATELGN
jgi:hypothetical protein